MRARILWGVGLAMLVSCAWIAVDLERERTQIVRAAEGRILNRSRIIDQYARETLRRVDMVLAHAADELRRYGSAKAVSQADLRSSLEVLASVDGLVKRLLVTDRDGAVVFHTGPADPAPANQGGRDAFSIHRDGNGPRVAVGAPVNDAADGRRMVPVSMRLTAPDGGFSGVIIAEIDPEHFRAAFDALGNEEGSFFTLFTRAGWIIARKPDDRAIVERRYDDSPMFREHLPRASRGTVRQVVVATGIESVYSYSALSDYPLVVAVGVSLTGALAPWRERLLRDISVLAAALAFLGFGTWLTLRSLRERERSHAAIRESEERYRRLFDTTADALMVIAEERMLLVNAATARMYGYATPADMVGTSAVGPLHPDDREMVARRMRAAVVDGAPQPPQVLRIHRTDGTWIEGEFSSEPFEYLGKPAVLTSARDVTRQRAAERRIARLNQLYQAQSRINDAMVRAVDFKALCDEVCRIAVDVGGMGCALVRLHDPGSDLLLPVAFHGPATGLIGRHDLPASGALGVSAEAFGSGRPIVVDDIVENPTTVHARAAALEYGIRSAAAFPLTAGTRPIGTFALFGVGTGFFDAEMAALLEETAHGLSYAHAKLASEAALVASERQYRELIDASPVPIRVAADDRVVLMNRAGLKLLGYDSVEQMQDRTLLDFVHPEFRDRTAARLRTLAEGGGQIPPIESVTLRRDGSAVPVEVVSIAFTHNNRPAVLTIFQDLTERKRAEAALRERERDLELAQQGGRIGSVIIDLASGTWMLSRVGYEVLGIADNGWRPLAEFSAMLAPEGHAEAIAGMRANIASGRRTDAEYQIVRPLDGRHTWIRVVTDTEFGADGTPLRRIGTVQDISEQKASRLALMQSEERYKLAIAASGVGVWDWDLKSGIAHLSEEYYRMFGYAPGEVTADMDFLMRLVHPEDRERTAASLRKQWQSGQVATDFEQRFVCKDGSVKWVLVRSQVAERDADGAALRVVGTASDLTARKNYEHSILRLSRLYAALSRTNAAVARSRDFIDLCNEVCRIAVEEGGMVAATIRQHDADTATLPRVGLYGPVDGMVGRAVIGVDDPNGMAPATFRSGQRVVIGNLAGHTLTKAAASDALRQGIRAGACFPLPGTTGTVGTFTVFAADSDMLDPRTADLLDEIARAVAFAHAKLAADTALAKNERDLARAQEAGRIGSVIIDQANGTWTASAVGCELLGIESGRTRSWSDLEALLVPESTAEDLAVARANMAAGRRSTTEYRIIRQTDGQKRWMRMVADSEFGPDGTPRQRVGTLQDITEQKEAQQRIERLSMLYEALSRTNAAILREPDFASLCARVCRIAVDHGGMVSSALRLYREADGMLSQVAEFGPRSGSIGRTVIAVDSPRGVAAAAFRAGRRVVVHDLAADPATSADAAGALAQGIRASAAFPLVSDGRPIGTFTVFAAEAASLDHQVSDLLQEIADALAYAHAKHLGDRQREEVEARVAAVVGSAMDAIITCDDKLDIVVFNQAAASMFRCSAAEALGTSIERFLPARFRDGHAGWMRAFAAGEANPRAMGQPSNVAALRADGEEFPAEASISHAEVSGRRIFTVIMRDNTARLAAERRIARLSALYAALSRTNEAIVRESDWHALCETVCRIIVEHKQVEAAVIRMPDARREHLAPFARCGRDTGPYGGGLAPMTDTEHPAVCAFRERRSVVINEMRERRQRTAANPELLAHDVHSLVVVPLIGPAGPIGTLSVFASEAAHFDEELARLYGELASDLAFAHQKLAGEAAMRESELRYRTLTDASPDAIRVMQDGRIVLVNPAYQRLVGAPSIASLHGRDSASNLAPAWRDRALARAREVIEHGTVAAPLEQEMQRDDGSLVPVEVTTMPFVYDGRPATLSILHDLTERRRAESALRESEEHYRTLFEAAPDAIRVICDGRVVMVNPAYLRHRGLDRPLDEVESEIFANMPEESARRARERMRIVIEERRALPPDEQRVRRANGELRTVEATSLPYTYHGRPAMLTILRDVTESRKAERELRESEEHYRTLVDASPDAIRVICEERIVMLNAAGRRLFAVDGDTDAIGHSPYEFIHPDHRARSRERLRRVIEERATTAPAETRYLRPDGTTVEAEVVTLPFTYGGKPAALSIIRDLTERNTSQRAIEEAERRYRGLVEASLNSVMLLSGDLVAYANPSTATMLGHARTDDALGTSVYSFVLPEFHQTLRTQISRLSAHANQTMPMQRLRVRRNDGAVLDVAATASSIELGGRTLIQTEMRDVTRERAALAEIRALNETLEARIAERTRELTASNRDLEAANRDLESFSYSVAHDLRAPLRSMAGFANLLEMDIASGAFDDVPAHTARITQNAARMNALIDGLLAVSRVTHGALNEDRVDFAALAAEAARDANPKGAARIEIGALPAVRGDASALRQVWANLISNAVKYSGKREHPEVRIGGELRETEYVFHVRDNGAGFDPAFAQRLFGVFQRLHSAHEFEGTGVGLAIVRRVVERHGGHVWAEGRPNAGATFYFTLPAARILTDAAA